MDRTARQALFIMIENIEKQLVGVKSLLGMTIQDDQPHRVQKMEEKTSINYTSKEDDQAIDDAIAIADTEKQRLMQELFSSASDA